jgi:hypothetical protein
MKRLVILLPVLLAFQVGVQPALAWTWPVDGPVLRPFSLGDDPYAGGQHRGIDVAGPLGAPVRAPAGGTVSFAGTVPGGGRTVTIQTTDGYSVTLLHLGAVEAVRSQAVGEGERIGTVGWSGELEHDQPYVHLGVRVTADSNGYVDPLTLLPERTQPAPEPAPQPAPEPEPAPTHAGERLGKPKTARPNAARPAAKPIPSPSARLDEPSVAVPKLRPAPVHRAARTTVSQPNPPALPVRTALRSFERWPHLAARVREPEDGRSGWFSGWPAWLMVVAAAATTAGLTGRALARRRQFLDAGSAHRPAAVHLEIGSPAAEHAGGLRLREEDRLVLDGDFERVLLAEAEPLPDLDRDDDTPKLVEAPNDARRRASRRSGCRSRRLSRPHRPRAWPFSAEAHA